MHNEGMRLSQMRFIYRFLGARPYIPESSGPSGFPVSKIPLVSWPPYLIRALFLLGPPWIATAYEVVLFGFALYKTLHSTTTRLKKGNDLSLYSLLLRDNLFYFFG